MTELVERVKGAGFNLKLTVTGPQLVPTVKGATMPPALMEEVRVNRGELVLWLRDGVRCETCDRAVGCPQDRDRLRGINPFCDVVGCPFRARDKR